ncbi:hypothetical protein LOD99_9782 [Oopsacas minuta]|uniref:Uncharacterized protein n=1 Tax=Oopsacas minuta TaxID=111878 RepID=A0AAV7KLP2_9METZ|nr:hypothetical protein LOD99_9782 [Oopsacas minuta]
MAHFKPIKMHTVPSSFGVMQLKVFYQSIVVDADTCITWLQDNGLLVRGMFCKCGLVSVLGKFLGVAEDRIRCPERNCRKVASLRIGSFCEVFNFPLINLLEFMYLWAKEIISTDVLVENLGWATATITDWKNFIRHLFERSFWQLLSP